MRWSVNAQIYRASNIQSFLSMKENETIDFLSYIANNYRTGKKQNHKNTADNDRFKDLAFNLGEMYQLSWESGFAKFRRFLAVNPNVRYSHLNKSAGNSVISKEALSAVFTRLFALESSGASACRPLDVPISGSYGITKNCPYCTKIGFHSDFFDYPWVEHCPVHNIPLATECPDCNKPWPVFNEYNKRDCFSCTKLRPIKLGDMQKLRQQYNQATNQFKSWKQLVDHYASQSSGSKYSLHVNSSKFRKVYLSDNDALELHKHFSQSSDELDNGDKATASSLNSRTFNVTLINRKLELSEPHYLNKYLPKRAKWTKGPRHKVFKDIKKFCNNHADEVHTFHRQSIFYSYTNSAEQVKVCPYCFAINLWLDTTTDFALSYDNSYFLIEKCSIDSLLRRAPSYRSLAFIDIDIGHDYFIIEDAQDNQQYLKWSLEYHLRGWFVEIFASVISAQPAYEKEQRPVINAIGQFTNFLQSGGFENWKYIKHFGTIRTFDKNLEQITLTSKSSLLPSFANLSQLPSFSGSDCEQYFESTKKVLGSDERTKYKKMHEKRSRRYNPKNIYSGGGGTKAVKKFYIGKQIERQQQEKRLNQIIREFADNLEDPSLTKKLRGFKLP